MADKETNLQTGFTAGEVSPYMQGRVDVAKVRLGANVARNFMVDFRGGVMNRPGTEYVGLAYWPIPSDSCMTAAPVTILAQDDFIGTGDLDNTAATVGGDWLNILNNNTDSTTYNGKMARGPSGLLAGPSALTPSFYQYLVIASGSHAGYEVTNVTPNYGIQAITGSRFGVRFDLVGITDSATTNFGFSVAFNTYSTAFPYTHQFNVTQTDADSFFTLAVDGGGGFQVHVPNIPSDTVTVTAFYLGNTVCLFAQRLSDGFWFDGASWQVNKAEAATGSPVAGSDLYGILVNDAAPLLTPYGFAIALSVDDNTQPYPIVTNFSVFLA